MAALPKEREGALYYRELNDGRDISVYEHHVGQFQLAVGMQGSGAIDSSFYYHDMAGALAAAVAWDGNGDAPVGWFRHPNSGRRREDGDPSKEHYQTMSERYFVRIDDDSVPSNELLVSSAAVQRVGAHDRVRVWNRGGLAGELVVVAGDGVLIAERLGLKERTP